MNRLTEEANSLTQLLVGKVVGIVRRHRSAEVLIEFTDGTRLFVDRTDDGLEFSVTGGQSSD
jgi:hypothetical protein